MILPGFPTKGGSPIHPKKLNPECYDTSGRVVFGKTVLRFCQLFHRNELFRFEEVMLFDPVFLLATSEYLDLK
jgi:hypothetical protein